MLMVPATTACTQSAGEGMVAVRGSVKFSDGTPVTGELATIVFQPDPANRPAKSASGSIQADGSFDLMTNAPGDGAYPGKYIVVLKVWSNYREQKLAVPDQYSSEGTSPLTVDIDDSGQPFDLEIER